MNNRRIVLLGFMGCGKSSVAKELALRLNCLFVDLDKFITETEGRSPAEIIQTDGEPQFRAIETRALEELLKQPQHRVIALGGGTWTIEVNRTVIGRENCLSVWLDAPFDLCWKRIRAAESTIRPMAPDRETAASLFASRRPDYELAQLRIDLGSTKELAEIVNEILAAATPS